jgi:hypothetical protein
MCNILEIVGIVVGIVGAAWGVWESHERSKQRSNMFYFLRGVKTNAEGNANNTGDTSAAWTALVTQIDDINRRLEKK